MKSGREGAEEGISQKTCLSVADFEAFGEKAKNHFPFQISFSEKLQNPVCF
jgi:hypothetical protein